tara:strand:- start:160 stop:570 length:411 start_codon:yes stop_codon:yes gene_type:complete
MTPWNYEAYCDRVVDADSIKMTVDLGFAVQKKVDVRLFGVDAPEMRGGTEETKAAARLATSRVNELVPVGTKVFLRSLELDKFGRSLAVIILENGDVVNDILLDERLAVRYDGENKEEIAQEHAENLAWLKSEGKI